MSDNSIPFSRFRMALLRQSSRASRRDLDRRARFSSSSSLLRLPQEVPRSPNRFRRLDQDQSDPCSNSCSLRRLRQPSRRICSRRQAGGCLRSSTSRNNCPAYPLGLRRVDSAEPEVWAEDEEAGVAEGAEAGVAAEGEEGKA